MSDRRGMTLIELMITIGISTIVTGVIILMLKTGFETYFFGEDRVLLEQTMDEVLTEVTGGGFDQYGVKDALEILDVTPGLVTFVPVWTDDSHALRYEDTLADRSRATPFILDRPFKAGSFFPLAEVMTEKGEWRPIPIRFVPDDRPDDLKPYDRVFLVEAVPRAAKKIRFLYHPDPTLFPDVAVTIAWQGGRLVRIYRGKTETIPRDLLPSVTLTRFGFRYFDNANAEVPARRELIPDITAVRAAVTVARVKAKKDAARPRQAARAADGHQAPTSGVMDGFAFINIRNTRTGGGGIIIREGARIRIPDSRHIRVFSLSNVIGAKPGGRIELEVRPAQGASWKVTVGLGAEGENTTFTRYTVEYPAGVPVYGETLNLTTDLPLNFLTAGSSRYDYDFDKGAENAVSVEGKAELIVTKMDALGANLFIRP